MYYGYRADGIQTGAVRKNGSADELSSGGDLTRCFPATAGIISAVSPVSSMAGAILHIHIPLTAR